MSERITRQNVEDRVAHLNRRMRDRGSVYIYAAQGRNGYIALDRLIPDEEKPGYLSVQSTVTVGTKREIADFLHAMMVALDDAATV